VPEGRQPAALDRSSLRADCARCFGLCCVAPAFAASADFAISKAAGQPCPNLNAGFGCSIHDRLRQRGFAGCTVYDCFGAGQKVAQVTFGGQDWRETPGIAQPMFAAFAVVRQLHELLWYLSEALTLEPARPVYAELRPALEETERLTRLGPDVLTDLDVNAYRRGINALLLRASELTRAEACRRQPGLAGADLRGADLIGKDLRKSDLRAASLRGAYLLGANLAGADLAVADLTGADLRGADLRGADLSGSLFVAQSQLDAATGNAATRLPSLLTAPSHWPA
jgi:Pentapeptide repeats (8 copies)